MPALLALAVAMLVAVVVASGRLLLDDGATRAIAALAAVLVLVLALVGVIGGVGVPGGEEASRPATERPAAEKAPGLTPLRRPSVRMTAAPPGSFPPAPRAVGDLDDGTVMVLGVSGLERGSTATVHQCPTGAASARECRIGLPVTMNRQGSATVLIDLEDRFEVTVGESGELDCRGGACSVVVFGSSRLEIVTVFDGPVPSPVTISAHPRAVPTGGTVTATAERLAPGTRATFVVCRADDAPVAACGDPTPEAVVDREGRAIAGVTIGAGRCPRGSRCAVAVVVDGGSPRAYAPVSLVGHGGASYDDGRVVGGIAVAVLLLLAALVLLRRTDWSPIGGDPFAAIVLPDDPFAEDPAS